MTRADLLILEVMIHLGEGYRQSFDELAHPPADKFCRASRFRTYPNTGGPNVVGCGRVPRRPTICDGFGGSALRFDHTLRVFG